MESERFRLSHEFGRVSLEGRLRAFGFLLGGDGADKFLGRFDKEFPT
jgi:hypothetical protein